VVHQKLSIPRKREKEKTKASEPTILLEQKKKEDKGDEESKIKHHSKGHSSLTHTCT